MSCSCAVFGAPVACSAFSASIASSWRIITDWRYILPLVGAVAPLPLGRHDNAAPTCRGARWFFFSSSLPDDSLRLSICEYDLSEISYIVAQCAHLNVLADKTSPLHAYRRDRSSPLLPPIAHFLEIYHNLACKCFIPLATILRQSPKSLLRIPDSKGSPVAQQID